MGAFLKRADFIIPLGNGQVFGRIISPLLHVG